MTEGESKLFRRHRSVDILRLCFFDGRRAQCVMRRRLEDVSYCCSSDRLYLFSLSCTMHI